MFDIENRGCRIGTSINTRSEKHGEADVVSALDIPVKNVVLDPSEVALLLEEPDLQARMFKPDENNTLVPAFPKVKRFPIDEKIESARVELTLDGGKVLTLPECKLRRLLVERLRGGGYSLALQIQATPKMTDPNVGRLLDHLDCDAKITIHVQNEQAEMQLPEGKHVRTRAQREAAAETPTNRTAKRKAAKERAKAETVGNVTPIHGRYPADTESSPTPPADGAVTPEPSSPEGSEPSTAAPEGDPERPSLQ